MIVRALVLISGVCFAVGFAMALGADGEPDTLSIVLVGISAVISMGFAVRRAFQMLREMFSAGSG